ncbi:hypothetical protein [Candidatus Parabeggiatoa sp. HSG14]|uniref:hypothetical protein n=1 Tax=Candidatus Parabeggiatoa sp. HSG14 TaxID=3055593 RepID=UPI0025A884DA|nr:hypothetical protein [Thiotrichales bacterium HSG14]
MLPNDADPSMDKKIGSTQEWLLWVHLNEYVKLKDEQITRMRFRDNLLYVTLAAFGGVISYTISNPSQHYYTFLVLPWVCLILGWTYLVNDEKITAIGRYIRLTMTEKVGKLVNEQPELLFGWEIAHRDDNWRKLRKKFQLLIDEVMFCLSGLVALGFFWELGPKSWNSPLLYTFILEGILLCWLGLWIFIYADLKKGRSSNSSPP